MASKFYQSDRASQLGTKFTKRKKKEVKVKRTMKKPQYKHQWRLQTGLSWSKYFHLASVVPLVWLPKTQLASETYSLSIYLTLKFLRLLYYISPKRFSPCLYMSYTEMQWRLYAERVSLRWSRLEKGRKGRRRRRKPVCVNQAVNTEYVACRSNFVNDV